MYCIAMYCMYCYIAIPQQGLDPGRGGLQEEKNRQGYSERYIKKYILKKNLFHV